MAWDRFHKSFNYTTGSVTMTTGYLSETITLGNNADASTSQLTIPTKSDATILVVFSADLGADTYVQIEHSVDGTTWFKQGEFEEDASVDHDDISKNMAKIAAIDDSLTDEDEGLMMLYKIDTHGAGIYTRFTVKANGQDESGTTATFYFLPHF
tara:strand:- start:1445 stop:1906 length:462 start_codon:yes stop_codon:yes gene_type:complete